MNVKWKKNSVKMKKCTHFIDCLSDCWLICWCFSSGDEFNSVYVLTGNNLWLFRLDCSVCIIFWIQSGDTFVWSSFIYKTLSELCRLGVLTFELCTISWDVEPENKRKSQIQLLWKRLLLFIFNFFLSNSFWMLSNAFQQIPWSYTFFFIKQ